MFMETDASLLGWGAQCGDLQSGGLWTNKERSMHINCLELLGGVFAVKTFAKQTQNLHIRLQMDNTATVAYVNRIGGTHSSTLSNMVCSLWQWYLQRGITLSAEHLQRGITLSAEHLQRGITVWRAPSEGHHTVCRAPPRNSQPDSRC